MTTGVIVGDDIALRKTAAANGKLVARLDEGTVVKILETNVFSEWYKVETDTRSGYVNRIYINIDPSLPSYQLDCTGTVFNCAEFVNVRATPSLKAKKLGKANKDATFKVTQAYASGAWHQIDYNGQTGYISSEYLLLTATVGNDPHQRAGDYRRERFSPKFSPTEYGYVLTATDGEVQLKATANDGVKVSIGSTGIASAKYTINLRQQQKPSVSPLAAR